MQFRTARRAQKPETDRGLRYRYRDVLGGIARRESVKQGKLVKVGKPRRADAFRRISGLRRVEIGLTELA